MPIFEYKCKDCGAEFEELIFSETDEVACEECGSKNTGKLMSCCGFKSGSGEGAADSGDGSQASKPQYRGRGSGCAGCAGGNCSSCG
ncbi:MAG: zinc ribbon domain-containing protein [Proteobacteria bacterium]|nr:zinc ribbon domain-containing protein [Pseudomonadota bacterium]MBU1612614.1 zinc ribbon domain-containing protein [Pseudomonadota bacterium]